MSTADSRNMMSQRNNDGGAEIHYEQSEHASNVDKLMIPGQGGNVNGTQKNDSMVTDKNM